jgi:DNA-binding transcriptional LysR family regulator
MHIETLKTFRDLAESGSFTRAAQMNLVSQSAVSQQLKALEARYGCRLLERNRRGRVELTEHGKHFYAGCREILERFSALELDVRERSTAIAGTVRVATVYSIGLHEFPPYVTRFMKAQPKVKVHLEYRRTDRVCEGCRDGSLDFGIVAFPIWRAGLEVIPWHEEPLVLVVAPGHPFARRRKVSLMRLQGAEFIAFERDIPTRRTIDRILARHRVKVNRVMEFDNIETIKRAVEVGSGLAIVPQTTVVDELRRGVLVKIAFVEGRFTRTVGIVHRRGRVLGAAARAFVEMMVSVPSERHQAIRSATAPRTTRRRLRTGRRARPPGTGAAESATPRPGAVQPGRRPKRA